MRAGPAPMPSRYLLSSQLVRLVPAHLWRCHDLISLFVTSDVVSISNRRKQCRLARNGSPEQSIPTSGVLRVRPRTPHHLSLNRPTGVVVSATYFPHGEKDWPLQDTIYDVPQPPPEWVVHIEAPYCSERETGDIRPQCSSSFAVADIKERGQAYMRDASLGESRQC
jgi:hypothetical protein